jgi:hypothetical protein
MEMAMVTLSAVQWVVRKSPVSSLKSGRKKTAASAATEASHHTVCILWIIPFTFVSAKIKQT